MFLHNKRACVLGCRNPDPVSNANINKEQTPWLVGDRFTYECQGGRASHMNTLNSCKQSGNIAYWLLTEKKNNLPICSKHGFYLEVKKKFRFKKRFV